MAAVCRNCPTGDFAPTPARGLRCRRDFTLTTCDSDRIKLFVDRLNSAGRWCPEWIKALDMARVLFLTPVWGWGGLERWLLTLARYCRRVAWIGTVFTGASKPHAEPLEALAGLMCTFPESRLAGLLAETDVVLTWATPDLDGLLAGYSGRVVQVCHVTPSNWTANLAAGSRRAVTDWVAVADRVLDGLPADRPRHMIPNGIDLKRLAAPAGAREAKRIEMGFSEGDFVVGFCARLVPQKGPMELLAALELLPARFKAFIIGDGHLRQDLLWRAHSRLPGRVWIGPPTLDVAPYYAAADCFCSLWPDEPWGISIGEAIAARLPLVATGAGILDQLRDGFGLDLANVSAERTPAEVARRIEAISRELDPAARSAASAQAAGIIREHFSAECAAAQWDRFLSRP